jgi:hypothetical protein
MGVFFLSERAYLSICTLVLLCSKDQAKSFGIVARVHKIRFYQLELVEFT